MTTRYVSVTDTAKAIRKALKDAFPGQKFSVRSSSYSGGASIYVSYEDGPSENDVQKITDAFSGATFDGMTDSMNYHTSTYQGETVHWGANFVLVRRRLSAATKRAAEKQVASLLNMDFTDLPEWFYKPNEVQAVEAYLDRSFHYEPYLSECVTLVGYKMLANA